ncbi:short-chain fatty acids transporter [Clostridium pasteurianum DSM 525 = ATCC 6013]|uniref:Short chain fatty acid transporter n=1 Tax=Clostridium pasteurianum DSM 525 = ATCC 6013 TaxID=1262449 RepID=A0A0H3J335_CLOPA|nr:short-chain fatty acid transporter [Clostridium pasteurianum]AJA47874.1 short-chain fatty acids transporter [Clostridium pasteurianum DSM 525 = ATCC 6013]AJA51862.1 short-chain fatty acids transporter [Clostridium pasteurianum DSM 525 = ATCC 6013]AOZ75165.1 short-chain fatty acid transporter [Clostridium pasteurianum DSM 525 = ATCC 6013]AOZ78960.1 short-chain fatty acid transporter [Clostridium pasteurianum]ELP59777.1 short-chain fatty acids transporter [Clostridium pasteurianum DSM 525 = A
MFKKITNTLVTLVQKYLPDPFLFACILTVIVFISGIIVTKQTPLAMLIHWNSGFWGLLSFSMQMALIVVTGHTLANTPIVNKGIRKIASIPKTPCQAIIVTTFVSGVACWINWGFGLILGAILAKEIAKKVKKVDYRLLIASAYSGFVVWHGGLSGSIPLTIAAGGKDVTTVSAGIIKAAIPTSQTLFSPYNLFIVIVILLTMPIINWFMHPKDDNVFIVDPKKLEDKIPAKASIDNKKERTPAERLENSFIISTIIGLMGIIYTLYYFVTNGFKLDLNVVNFTFLFLSILLHKTPRKFLNAASSGVKATTGIIVQFPFYAGIMGMMIGTNAVGISLGKTIASGLISIATPTTFPLFAILSTAFCTIFIPSGGGEWALQAPIIMPAAANLGISPSTAAMAISWGDAWACMIQPFWALPALAIAGLGAKDIMGFCIIDLFYTGIIIMGTFLIGT